LSKLNMGCYPFPFVKSDPPDSPINSDQLHAPSDHLAGTPQA